MSPTKLFPIISSFPSLLTEIPSREIPTVQYGLLSSIIPKNKLLFFSFFQVFNLLRVSMVHEGGKASRVKTETNN